MTIERNAALIAALRELDTEIVEVSSEQDGYTDPYGKTHTNLPPLRPCAAAFGTGQALDDLS